MASARNVKILTGTTNGQQIILDFPYDYFIIGDEFAGSTATTLFLPFSEDLQDGYTFYVIDPQGVINLNGPYILPNSTESVSGNTVVVNSINITNNYSTLFQPFSVPSATYKITYEGTINNVVFFTLTNQNSNSSYNTTIIVTEDSFDVLPSTINDVSFYDDAPAAIQNSNQYCILDIENEMNFLTQQNTVLVNCNLTGNTNNPDHYLIMLPGFGNGLNIGSTLKFAFREVITNVPNSQFLMIASVYNDSVQSAPPRIIAPNYKTYFNGNYFLPMFSGESLELTWDGVDWIVTNISKQEYVQFSAKTFFHLNSGTYYDATYVEHSANKLTYDIDDYLLAHS